MTTPEVRRLFGRRESRDHSRHYLWALLVQSGDGATNRQDGLMRSGVPPQRIPKHAALNLC